MVVSEICCSAAVGLILDIRQKAKTFQDTDKKWYLPERMNRCPVVQHGLRSSKLQKPLRGQFLSFFWLLKCYSFLMHVTQVSVWQLSRMNLGCALKQTQLTHFWLHSQCLSPLLPPHHSWLSRVHADTQSSYLTCVYVFLGVIWFSPNTSKMKSELNVRWLA